MDIGPRKHFMDSNAHRKLVYDEGCVSVCGVLMYISHVVSSQGKEEAAGCRN